MAGAVGSAPSERILGLLGLVQQQLVSVALVGILLAAVFAVLGVLPLIALAQIGSIVCVGVLLDTLLVRTLLVPAVAALLDDRFWWPAPASKRRGYEAADVAAPIPA